MQDPERLNKSGDGGHTGKRDELSKRTPKEPLEFALRQNCNLKHEVMLLHTHPKISAAGQLCW